MRTDKKIIILLLLAGLAGGAYAQENFKREMRAAWVASVANIDWPKYEHRGKPAEQQTELIRMLDLYESLHMNAILLQVRTECDALYQSSYEPWSRYLSWSQGDDPGYDPLQFALDEARKRGIEVHAWLNPYRLNASANPGTGYFDEEHIYIEHPEWAMEYDNGKYILNPGRPEVMSYIGMVVRDLVSKYAIDGLHFDDYFYSYGGTPNSLDQREYDLYGAGMSRGDWRRDNVNRMIDTVYRVIQEENPSVRFGVSPFGIYRPGQPSGIVGMDAYSQIYCDPLAWLEDDNLDYLTPQMYWPTGGGQDFESLVNWWSDQLMAHDRQLIPGQGTYRLDANAPEKNASSDPAPLHESKAYFDMDFSRLEHSLSKSTSDPVADWTLGQIGLQIDLIRENRDKGAMGSVFFSAKDLDRVKGLADFLKDNKYLYPTLMPEMTWKADDTPESVQNVRIEKLGDAYLLRWDGSLSDNEEFAVYVSDGESDENVIIAHPSFLQGTFTENQVDLAELVLSASSWITLTCVSPTGRESLPFPSIKADVALPLASLLSPASDETVSLSDQLRWGSELSSPLYQLQISTNASFSNIIYESEWISETEADIYILELEGENQFSWRVRVREDVIGPWSPSRNFFTGYPAVPELTYPTNLNLNVSRMPTVKWSSTASSEGIKVEISTYSNFESLDAQEVFPAGDKEGKMSTELQKDSWYYIRIQATNSYGYSNFTGLSTFQTSAGDIPDVELVSPANGSIVSSYDTLTWMTEASEGNISYQLEIAIDAAFTGILHRSQWMPEDEILISDIILEGKRKHYWRVKGKSEFGESEFSGYRDFTTGYPSRPKITAPAHLSEGVDAMPEISWTVDEYTDSVYVEFSENSNFGKINYSETMSAAPGSGLISASLKGFTWYYCRIRAVNEYGLSVSSPVRYFETGEGTGIENLPGLNALTIYPVPLAKGALHVSFRGRDVQEAVVEVQRISGQLVFQSELHPGMSPDGWEIQIDRKFFPGPGMYFLLVHDQNKVHAKQILVL